MSGGKKRGLTPGGTVARGASGRPWWCPCTGWTRWRGPGGEAVLGGSGSGGVSCEGSTRPWWCSVRCGLVGGNPRVRGGFGRLWWRFVRGGRRCPGGALVRVRPAWPLPTPLPQPGRLPGAPEGSPARRVRTALVGPRLSRLGRHQALSYEGARVLRRRPPCQVAVGGSGDAFARGVPRGPGGVLRELVPRGSGSARGRDGSAWSMPTLSSGPVRPGALCSAPVRDGPGWPR